jgi:hypothetical protein
MQNSTDLNRTARSPLLHLFLLATFLLIILVMCRGWSDSGRRWGGGSSTQRILNVPSCVVARVSAYRDLAVGNLRILSWGGAFPERRIYASLLREQLNIRLDVVLDGCVVTAPQVARWATYNAVMLPRIEQRFGRPVFARLLQEARRRYGAERQSRSGRPASSSHSS